MAGIKIVDLPALGRDLISTDLLEVSLSGSGSRKITGQEIMNASKLAVGSTPIVAGTVGRLLFQGTGNVLGQSQWLFYDAANIRLGVATSTPLYTLDVAGNIHGSTIFSDYNIVSTSGNVWLSDGYAIGDYGTGNNRIEFYNNRISLFGNGNEALRIVGATRNVLIGTTTDAGYKLDVNGTARVSGLVTATLSNFNSTHSGNTTRGFYIVNSADSVVRAGIEYDGTNAFVQLAGRYNNGAAFLRQDGSNGNISFLRSGSEYARIFGATGNVGINTTTDDGFRLDVNGTARVQGATTITGLVTLSNNIEFNAYNRLIGTSSYPLSTIYVGTIRSTSTILSSGGTTGLTLGNNGGTTQMQIRDNGNVLINTTTDAGYKLDVNGSARFNGNLTFQTTSWILDNSNAIMHRGGFNVESIAFNLSRMVFTDNNGFVFNGNNSAATLTSSSIVDIQSTTKGFLPPRMTNAQRAAIASPAVGLIVYCTDATEGLYVYKSTGWTFMV